MLILVTMPNCNLCDEARTLFKEKGLSWEEVSIEDEDNPFFRKYRVYRPAYIVDTETNKVQFYANYFIYREAESKE